MKILLRKLNLHATIRYFCVFVRHCLKSRTFLVRGLEYVTVDIKMCLENVCLKNRIIDFHIYLPTKNIQAVIFTCDHDKQSKLRKKIINTSVIFQCGLPILARDIMLLRDAVRILSPKIETFDFQFINNPTKVNLLEVLTR